MESKKRKKQTKSNLGGEKGETETEKVTKKQEIRVRKTMPVPRE